MFFFSFFDNNEIELLKSIFKSDKFYMPIRWDGKDFYDAIYNLYKEYLTIIKPYLITNEYYEVKEIIQLIEKAIKDYLSGSPSYAYKNIDVLISKYFSRFTIKEDYFDDYYRILKVDKNISYNRERIFHPPYNARSNISTNRYSIAGYPCLYLSDNFEQCLKEIGYNPYEQYYIASKFKIISENKSVKLLDLSIKPQDILNPDSNSTSNTLYSYKNYLYVFPLILACSFIRSDNKTPFAPEYIVPQLLLECVRNNFSKSNDSFNVVGIKYFSCNRVTNKHTNNVVFPTYKKKEHNEYCEVLNKIFELTKPLLINDYDTIEESKNAIDVLKDYRRVMRIK